MAGNTSLMILPSFMEVPNNASKGIVYSKFEWWNTDLPEGHPGKKDPW